MRTVYPMRQKSNAVEALREYELMVVRPEGLRIKRLRSDNGGEYLGEEFSDFCKENGIEQEFSAPYTAAQNGMSECSWRTIFEGARTSMIAAELPPKYWAEAVCTATHCLNRTPTRVLGGATPHENWHGCAPRLNHLRVFGCTAYVFIESRYRKKLHDKA